MPNGSTIEAPGNERATLLRWILCQDKDSAHVLIYNCTNQDVTLLYNSPIGRAIVLQVVSEQKEHIGESPNAETACHIIPICSTFPENLYLWVEDFKNERW